MRRTSVFETYRRGEKSQPARDAVEALGRRQLAGERRVEEEVRMTGAHALAVEAVSQAVPDRERVVPDVPVQGEVDATSRPLERCPRLREEVVAERPRHAAQSRCPGVRLVRRATRGPPRPSLEAGRRGRRRSRSRRRRASGMDREGRARPSTLRSRRGRPEHPLEARSTERHADVVGVLDEVEASAEGHRYEV